MIAVTEGGEEVEIKIREGRQAKSYQFNKVVGSAGELQLAQHADSDTANL